MLCALYLLRQLLPALDCAKAGIGFRPAVRLFPFVAIVQLVDNAQPALIYVDAIVVALDNVLSFAVFLVVDALAHRSGRRYNQAERLFSRRHAVHQHVV